MTRISTLRTAVLVSAATVGAIVAAAVGVAAHAAPPPRADGMRHSPAPIAPSAPAMKSKGGALDTTFDGDGKFMSAVEDGVGIVVQADGKIVVAGHSSNWLFALMRFNLDGTLDQGFGVGGYVADDFDNPGGGARAMALQTDQRIIVAGGLFGSGGTIDFAMARYLTDGSRDTGFAAGGLALTDLSGGFDAVNAVVLQPDGKIVAVGETLSPTSRDFGLVRYDADGSLDPGFGNGGMVTTDLNGTDDVARAVALQPDGHIVVAGSSAGSPSRFGIVRYEADGSLDTSFGTGGVALVDVGALGGDAYTVVLQADGGIIVGGERFGNDADFAMSRLEPDGTLDKGFGKGGTVITDLNGGSDGIRALSLAADGKIVAAGYGVTSRHDGRDRNFGLVRYNAIGSIDHAFGDGGVVTTNFITTNFFNHVMGGIDIAQALAVQPDGRLVAAGTTSWDTEPGDVFRSATVARYLP